MVVIRWPTPPTKDGRISSLSLSKKILHNFPTSLPSNELRLFLCPLLHTEYIVQSSCHEDVETDVSPKNPVVPPPLTPEDIGGCEILISVAETAISTLLCIFGILQLPRRLRQECLEIFATRLSGRWIKDRSLALGTGHDSAMQLRRHDAPDPVGKRRDAVHEDPEPGQRVWGL